MLYVLGLVGFAAVAVLTAHVGLRKHYGRNPVLWARVEIAWWALSFLSATLAAAQFEDKLGTVRKEPLAAGMVGDWDFAREFFPELAATVRSDAFKQQFIAAHDAKTYAQARLGVRRAERAFNSPDPAHSQPADVYTGSLDTLCLSAVGTVKFSESDPDHYRYSAPGEDSGFAGILALECTYTYAVARALDRLWDISKEHEALRPFYGIAQGWYFLLIIGFALKFTKNTNDVVKARREAARAAIAESPTVVAENAPV